MRRFLSALLPAALLLAACGGGGTPGGSGRDLNLDLGGPPAAAHAGIHLAIARGYDRAVGVTLRLDREPPDLRLARVGELDPERAVAVMAVLPGELYLAADRVILDERRDDVRAAVEALQRGYEETIVDPESAVGAMVDAGAGERVALLADLEAIAPKFKRGAREFGFVDASKLPPGTADATLVAPSER
jgi:ABC-type nitrate/sulfonate/bicarbonate transport system substrate-binding protein